MSGLGVRDLALSASLSSSGLMTPTMQGPLGMPLQPSMSTSILAQHEQQRGVCACIFPIPICPCFICLPRAFTKIWDCLHLILVLGVLASLGCIGQMIEVLSDPASWDTSSGVAKVISAICVIPSTLYFIKVIATYDEQLREKKQRHQDEVEGLIENINGQVSEMRELCEKIAQNANEFATGRFNDKNEQFTRFLQHLKVHYADLYADAKMLEELRKFVLNYFRIYAGTLINPSTNPLMHKAKEDLARCTTVQEVCDEAMQRLRSCQVATNFQAPVESPVLSGPSFDSWAGAEEGGQGTCACCDALGCCGTSWLKFGECGRFGIIRSVSRSSSGDSLPMSIHFGCGCLRLLSLSHVNVLAAFVLDVGLVGFELYMVRPVTFILVVINFLCVMSMLFWFEEIDEIACLEKQIRRYELRKEEVTQRREEARASWEQVQELHDLWLYRTLPSLSIMGKVWNHLQDEDMKRKEAIADGKAGADTRPEFLQLTNESLDCLQQRLGSLEDWRKGGPLPDAWKKSVGSKLKACERERDMNKLIGGLHLVTQDTSALDDHHPEILCSPPPSPRLGSRSPSPPGSASLNIGQRLQTNAPVAKT